MSCPRLNAPIVLAHGLFGFRRIGIGRLTLTSYFRGIPDHLRQSGNRVLVTRVPSIAGVKLRARALGEQIEHAFPGQAVHLIGHSMGGLDARQLLADPEWAGRILSVTTVGTPHLGSALADCARQRVGAAYRILRTLRIEHRGFLDVTRRAALAVNRNGAPPPRFPCFSVAGDPTIEQVCWPLQPFYNILADLEGPNDGLVSVVSAHGFGTPLPDWPVDHFRQLNWLSPSLGPTSVQPIRGMYAAIIENLAEHGFAAEQPISSGPDPINDPLSRSIPHRKRFVFPSFLGPLRRGRPVQ
ncbi:MAG: hypothetical protein NVSMB9_03790 [Isosphaeraceae bacterium]